MQEHNVMYNGKIFQDARDNDIIILVIGKAGFGKSTFINTLLGKPTMETGSGFALCTTNFQLEIVDQALIQRILPTCRGCRVIIVDTPGLNCSKYCGDDSVVLRHIKGWLASCYPKGMQLGGIIYLEDLGQTRMRGPSDRTVKQFEKLCGEDGLGRVILCTTFWWKEHVLYKEDREKVFIDRFWRYMMDGGSKVMRFRLAQDSAFDVMRHILEQVTIRRIARAQHGTGKNKFWKRENIAESDQVLLEGGRQTDVVIPVVGETGVGKSTFINTLLGKGAMEVGHGVRDCTSNLQWVLVDPKLIQRMYRQSVDYRVFIVDTPGYNTNTYAGESDVLRCIKAWIAASYGGHMKLGGIIHLHNIEGKGGWVSKETLDLFEKLCGGDALSGVVLCTTRWEEVDQSFAEDREKELKTQLWGKMIKKKATTVRFNRTQESALGIVQSILELK